MTPTEQEKNDYLWRILHTKLFEEKIKEAFHIFREEGIEPVLIKGWAAARYYPQNIERFYTDIDLCIEPKYFQKAFKLLKKENVTKLSIDLHQGFRHLDTVTWENLFKNTQLLKIESAEIRVLCPEDHLRILCVHWLTDGGAYKERLLDIFYAIENRPADFDWEKCLGVVSEKRRRWIVSTIGLTQKYFGLSLKNTPIEMEAEKIPKWLIKTVEKEWASNVGLMPLHRAFHDKKQFLKQIRKRLPPNPIQATIELEGSFDERTRMFYQVGSVLKRLTPMLKRIKTILLRQTEREK